MEQPADFCIERDSFCCRIQKWFEDVCEDLIVAVWGQPISSNRGVRPVSHGLVMNVFIDAPTDCEEQDVACHDPRCDKHPERYIAAAL
jgi:hypothetical protein